MKHSMLFLALVLAASVVGCRESGVINPVANPTSHSPTEKIIIPVDTLLRSPITEIDNFFILKGQVDYILAGERRFKEDVEDVADVDLTVSLYVAHEGEATGNVYSKSRDRVALSLGNDGLLQKRYAVAGRDELALNAVFKVTLNEITLNKIWLSLNPNIDDN